MTLLRTTLGLGSECQDVTERTVQTCSLYRLHFGTVNQIEPLAEVNCNYTAPDGYNFTPGFLSDTLFVHPNFLRIWKVGLVSPTKCFLNRNWVVRIISLIHPGHPW